MHDSATLEAQGVPTVPIITTVFAEEARVQRVALGMADLIPAIVTHPLSTLPDAEIAARAREAVPQVRAILLGAG